MFRRNFLAYVSAASLIGLVPRTAIAQVGARVYNIADFGAVGDGATLNTEAVQKAIDTCTNENGGTVLVPAGDFVIGTIELKSNVTLQIAAKGRLLGSAKIEHYKAGNNVPPGNGNIVMISAANAENVRIVGPGTINGNGAKFFTGRGDMTGPGQNSAQGYYQRPHLLIFYRCTNLVIRDVFLTASAYHCTRILQCQRVNLDAVRIHNRVNLNNDGFHINSSQYVHIINCDITCQDDACALFGSFTNAREILLSASRVLTAGAVFLKLVGPGNEGITIDGGDISKAARALVFAGGATPKAVKMRRGLITRRSWRGMVS